MSYPYGGVGSINALPSWTGRTKCVYPEIVCIYLDVYVFNLRQDRNSNSGCMDPSLGLSLGNPLDAVYTTLELKLTVNPFSFYEGNNLLKSPYSGRTFTHYLHLPALSLCISGIHPEEVCDKEGSLIPTCSGPYLKQDVLIIIRVLGKEEYLYLLFKKILFL